MDTSKPTLFDKETVATLVEYAKTTTHGKRHYLELKTCPLTSVSVVVDEEGQVSSMDFVGMMDNIDYHKDKYKTIPIGYEWYQESTTTTSNSNTHQLSIKQWRRQFLSLITKIDSAIERHHGILCHRTEDISDTNAYHYMILHFVDVMSIYFMQKTNEGINESSTKITSMLLSSIPVNITDTFTSTLTNVELDFINNNGDLLCYIYGYWHNYSNKPIRLLVPNHPSLERFCELSKWNRFVGHQEVKWDSLKRRVHERLIAILYLTE